jgi:3-oxoadipate enol-lactonase
MPEIEANGTRLHYQFEGSEGAPTVMLSNSLGTNLHMWDPQIPVLAGKFQVLRYDSRGHGQSSATPGPYTIDGLGNDAIALLDALRIEKVFFCGLSLGGVIAQWMGINAADRVNAIVISNSAAKIGNDEFWNKRIEKLREGGIAPVAGAQVLRWFTERYVAAQPQVIEKMKQMFEATPVDGYIATCQALRDSDLRESIQRIRARTLVISGVHDLVTPPADGKFIASQIPGARYTELNASHLSSIEDSAAFSAAVLQFFSAKDAH